MPIYEYECPHCHNVFEEWVKLSCAHGEEPCPKCGTSSPRVISHTSFVLKGEGWYVTEYGYRKNVHEDQGSDQGGAAKKDDSSTTQASEGTAKTDATSSKAQDAKPAETSQAKTTPKPATDTKSSPKKQESSGSA